MIASIAPCIALRYYRQKRMEDGCKKCEFFRGWTEKCEKEKVPKYAYDECGNNPNDDRL